jgi:hypothetical protein
MSINVEAKKKPLVTIRVLETPERIAVPASFCT